MITLEICIHTFKAMHEMVRFCKKHKFKVNAKSHVTTEEMSEVFKMWDEKFKQRGDYYSEESTH